MLQDTCISNEKLCIYSKKGCRKHTCMSLEIKNGTLHVQYADDAHKGITKFCVGVDPTRRRERESGQKPAGGGWCWRKWNGLLSHGTKAQAKA